VFAPRAAVTRCIVACAFSEQSAGCGVGSVGSDSESNSSQTSQPPGFVRLEL
jgi:hypothetical protein